jgi:dihydrodipicolinate reductase
MTSIIQILTLEPRQRVSLATLFTQECRIKMLHQSSERREVFEQGVVASLDKLVQQDEGAVEHKL